MAVLVALVIGTFLGFRDLRRRWPFLLAPAAVALELVVNAIRFGVDSVVVWGFVLSALTFLGAIGGLRFGAWLRERRIKT